MPRSSNQIRLLACLLCVPLAAGAWHLLQAAPRSSLALESDAPGAAPAGAAPVGTQAGGPAVLPISQFLDPAGRQVSLPGTRPQAIALSPDGRILVTSGKAHDLIVLDAASGAVSAHIPLPSDKSGPGAADAAAAGASGEAEAPVSSHILEPDKDAQLSYTGLVFSPDGSRLYLSNVNGSIKVFGVRGAQVSGLFSIPLPAATAPRRKKEIPAGLALSADGQRLYAALNLSNALLEIDAGSGRVLRRFEVGVAPYDVALAGGKAYVSNWGGRRPDGKSVVGPAGHGTTVRVDSVRHVAAEGSVSIINLGSGSSVQVLAGRHASALAVAPSQKHIVVANSAEDTLSVLDAGTDRIVSTIEMPSLSGFFGSIPDALAFSPDGATLYAALGGRNAVAVIDFAPARSRVRGLIPVGWFPGALALDSRRGMLAVANIKGAGSGLPPEKGAAVKFNTHQYAGTLSLISLPNARQMSLYTRRVLECGRQSALALARLPARAGQPPRPIPERVGEPSVFKHVVYIIKENRTYDQVLGDIQEGNGDASLCTFGADVTPNQHKMVREFALLDNTYCSGILSADGHQWADSGIATDYMERSFAGFPRSYPDGMDDNDVDALAYSPQGFIWDNALRHNKSLRDYGEFTIGTAGWKDKARKPGPRFADFYRDYAEGSDLTQVSSRPAIESLRPYIHAGTIGWNLSVPDVVRARKFIEELKGFEANGRFPNLSIICLPNDHTAGTREGAPTPAAQVADNDLAFGRIVEAISHSRFWKQTCVLAIEDDPQAGWDHVSGYRTTAYVISPYTKRKAVVSTRYNQPALLRSIELMLGLPPMNAMDAAASPLSDCFNSTPDLTPFESVPNKIPLDQMNPAPRAIRDPIQKRYALLSASLPLQSADKCPDALLNQILWHARKGRAPYPGGVASAARGAGEREEEED